MSEERGIPTPDTGILFYQTEDGQSRIQVRLQDGTVRLNQRLLSELYQVAVHTISEHISAIYGDHELSQEATIRKFRIVKTDGSRQVKRQVDFYNLDWGETGCRRESKRRMTQPKESSKTRWKGCCLQIETRRSKPHYQTRAIMYFPVVFSEMANCRQMHHP
jgi:hypothetical protein